MDIFLSYNSADHGLVEDVARRLRDAGLEPFLDRWYLAPGARWRAKLEATLNACKAFAIFVGPGEMGSWQQREVDVALDLQSRSPNLPVIPVLLPGCEPPLGFLRQLTWVDLRTQTIEQGIAILIKAARGEAPGPEVQKDLDSVRASICPYRGLLHFREEDAPYFFGHEVAIDKLMGAVQLQKFVTVVGASGSGKSSVVRAGLVPRLRSDRHTAWEIVILVPTDQPLKALARSFVPLLEPAMGEVDRLAEAAKLAEHFRSGTISLNDIVERMLEKQSGTNRVLIVVDQFEELYTLTSDEEARRRFLDELLAASSRAGSKANIALTLRGDFVGKALAYRPLSDRLQDAQINLGPMTREELECAIRKPAEKIGLEFESGLVKRILNDVGDEPGNLPLLEFVLKELWDKRRGRALLNETYDAIGGLQGAVATKADEFLTALSPAEQKILQRVFLRIVRPSESGLDMRRRATFSELPLEGTQFVVKLADQRLLVTNKSAGGAEQTVEVAHEALISNWNTLRAWVNEDREFLLWRARLDAWLQEWERADESAEALLRGPLLIEAQKWFDQRSQDLSDQERKFISASREERERLAREEKERQARELEAAKNLARMEAKAAQSLRRLSWILTVVALLAIGALIFGVWQQQEAERQKDLRNRENALAFNDTIRGATDKNSLLEQRKSFIWSFSSYWNSSHYIVAANTLTDLIEHDSNVDVISVCADVISHAYERGTPKDLQIRLKSLLYGTAGGAVGVVGKCQLKIAENPNRDLYDARIKATVDAIRNNDLDEVNLRGAILNGARLYQASMRGAFLQDAELNFANLSETNLDGARLSGAHLRKADLRRAFLKGADLSNVDLNAADLSGANLSLANLHAADLTGADLRDTKLDGARLDETILSDAIVRSLNAIIRATGQFKGQPIVKDNSP